MSDSIVAHSRESHQVEEPFQQSQPDDGFIDVMFFDGTHHYISGRNCQYPPSVEAGDIVQVDVNVRKIDCDSLYLLICKSDGFAGSGKPHTACRRFQRIPGNIIYDSTGRGDWQPMDKAVTDEFQVAGRITKVFKPAEAKGWGALS